jgi:hypothetical protein
MTLQVMEEEFKLEEKQFTKCQWKILENGRSALDLFLAV